MNYKRQQIAYALLTDSSPRITVENISAPVFTPVALVHFIYNYEKHLGMLVFDPTTDKYGTYIVSEDGSILRPYTIVKKNTNEVKIEEITVYLVGEGENNLCRINLEPVTPYHIEEGGEVVTNFFAQADETTLGLSKVGNFWGCIDPEFLQAVTNTLNIVVSE